MIKLLKTTNKAMDMCEVLSHKGKPLCLEYSAKAMETIATKLSFWENRKP